LYTVFSFTQPSPTAISTLSLHDALPIFGALPASRSFSILLTTTIVRSRSSTASSISTRCCFRATRRSCIFAEETRSCVSWPSLRSEEHTSELQSQSNLVCRLLLEKKKKL